MQAKILISTLLMIILVGCQKQPEQKNEAIDSKVEFESIDQKITGYLDILDNPTSTREEQIKILCEDYPKTYEIEYVPALLALQPESFKKDELMKELKISLDYYTDKLNINCP
ncbi:hypothetical protein [Acinetobacter beijerinckii]|uniref:hypothetical protein n=1 Tax=Acinetobacter beijerinckii TaxID=262668 RepID=UPI00300B9DBE